MCPDIEYQRKLGASDTIESAVDDTEAAWDRNAKKVIICPVTDPNKEKAILEKEIIEYFEEIWVKALKMKSRSTNRREFKAIIVEISPVNLNKIWGRRLGLKNCSMISYDDAWHFSSGGTQLPACTQKIQLNCNTLNHSLVYVWNT